jgi:hypothetical protein
VIVTVAAPTVAVLEAVNVSVLVPVVLAGLNEAVTPAGRPLAESATEPAKPFTGSTVMVLFPLALWPMLRLLGEADNEKLGTGATPVRVAIRVAPMGLPQPVTRSYPVTALKPVPAPAVGRLLPLVMSWKLAVKFAPTPML